MNLKKEVKVLVQNITGVKRVSLHKPMREVGVESLAFSSLVFELEDKYNIELSLDEVARFTTLGQFIQYVKGKINQ